MDQLSIWVLDIDSRAWPGLERQWLRQGLLEAAELKAVAHYRNELNRRQFLGGRALARSRLAALSARPPRGVSFEYEANGKPYALIDGTRSALHFNLSHSGARVACAVADCAVGVDIEAREVKVDAVAIARRFFTTAESRWITSDAESAALRFAALWTLKEAYLKATGSGLTIPLDSVTIERESLRRFRAHSVAAGGGALWHCRLSAVAGFWLALCTAAPRLRPGWRQLSVEALA